MAMAADSSLTTNTNTTTATTNNIPWAKVVRGEPETTSSPEQDNISENDNAGGGVKKAAWNKPINGVVEMGPVMGAVSWPALSECTKPSSKSSADLGKASDGSVSVSSQDPVISHPQQKQANSNSNANTNQNPKLTPNHTQPVRQRSFKRGGGSGQSGFNRPLVPPPPPPPLPPPFPVFEIPYGNLVPEPLYKGNNWESRPMGGGVGAQSHGVNDHPSQRNSSRRGNFGPRPRGNGIYHNGYGGRREQDRDWNGPRNSNGRDVHVPHQMVHPPPRGFIRGPPPPPPPPGSTPFINARPFGNPMGFDMASPFFYVPPMAPEPFRGGPFVAQGPPPPPMFFPVTDPPLPALIVKQIDYYFSDSNLVKDDYLRSNMDDQGWVPITLIASFPRVQQLTNNPQLILDSLRASIVVEVQGGKLRRRNAWQRWIPSSIHISTNSSPQSTDESTENMLANSLQKVTLDVEPTATNLKTGEPILANGVEGTTEEACGSNHM